MSRKSALQPLSNRLNNTQMERRAERMGKRIIQKEHLQAQINYLGNGLLGFVSMGFWARLRWLLFGPVKPKSQE